MDAAAEFVDTMSQIFATLGRALICLDRDFVVIHASEGLDEIGGPGAHREIVGKTAEAVLCPGLFGTDGNLRRALEAGERREGWGAALRLESGRRVLLSMTVAPVCGIDSALCDPRVAYLMVVRGASDPGESSTSLPTLFSGMVGRSPAMLAVFQLIHNLEESDATVLIGGESGTGKELVARAVHVHSPRRDGRFVAVNCGALPPDLLESELFGHVRGAFTGAIRDRTGRFELAAGGTLFLDEVGDLPLPLQVKLLRVLQERTFERVGDSHTLHSDARIVAATNLDLQRAVADGRFREDLYYRLRVVPISIPPLRARREDIEPLARHLLARVASRHARSMILSPDALRAILAYDWPGNARELENALEYAVAICRGQTIHPGDLPVEIQRPDSAAPDRPAAPAVRGPAIEVPGPAAADHDVEVLKAALDANGWNREETARQLGMSRTTLWRKMREGGLVRSRT